MCGSPVVVLRMPMMCVLSSCAIVCGYPVCAAGAYDLCALLVRVVCVPPVIVLRFPLTCARSSCACV